MPREKATARRSRLPVQRPQPGRGWAVAAARVLAAALTVAALLVVGLLSTGPLAGRMPRDLARALQARWLQDTPGHAGQTGPTDQNPGRPTDAVIDTIAKVLITVDRGPSWHKPLPELSWSGAGTAWGPGRDPMPRPGPDRWRRVVRVSDVASLQEAIALAEPGTNIVLEPGRYRLEQSLHTQRHGKPDAPIGLSSDQLGSAVLEVQATVALTIRHAHWTVERLVIEGHCSRDTDCEHALHIKGDAPHTRIRDGVLRDFNAPIKVNRDAQHQPDDGEIARCTIANRRPRHTERPVTGIDLVAGARWHIHHNHLADFISTDARRTTYAAFAKGGARDTVFESNTVVCEQQLRGHAGSRVGVSLGGGGTATEHCRDGQACRDGEHLGGRLRNNLIIGCSDAGIDLHRAHDPLVAHNTLLDTAGIVGRHHQTRAFLWANWVDGPVREQADAHLMQDSQGVQQAAWQRFFGFSGPASDFVDARSLDLRWREPPSMGARGPATPAKDLCGQPRPPHGARPGAFEDFSACLVRLP